MAGDTGTLATAADLVPEPRAPLDGAGLVARLAAALDADRLELHYQPIYELSSGRLIHHEALARWHDGDGWVSPAQFIPAAEACGLIGRLTAWALRTACATAAAWSRRDGTPRSVMVNVSARDFTDETVLAAVSAALAETGLPAAQLGIELTESAVIEDLASTVAQLQALRALGLRVALDDFGTGYSSLTLIRQLPVTTVKIDRSFVAAIDTDSADAILVRLVIEAAHSLGMRVCAEGVEREPQLEHLAALGCDSVQGYLLGRPAAGGADVFPANGTTQPLGQGGPPSALLLPPSSELVFTTDRHLRITYMSASSIHLLGRHPTDLAGTSLLNLAHPTDRAALEARPGLHLRRAAAGRPTTLRLRHARGDYRWLRISSRLVDGDVDGPRTHVVSSGQDVTASTRARQELERSQRLFRTAFDIAPYGLGLLGIDRRFLQVNSCWAQLLGRSSSSLVGVAADEITHPDDLERCAVAMTALLTGAGTTRTLPVRYLTASGEPVAVGLTLTAAHEPGGRPGHLVARISLAGPPVGSGQSSTGSAWRSNCVR